ncbi:MAG: Crp/Fnr family transcriptional regulator [Gammaproteobacteria bacterium]|nr:Crp/Fnr family transcriptional regulator [Gammaproteobacteria bacterium]MBT8133015.1 Crp/Fnr family transcriptional regulator [Gammaproteobacteria bacterium]NNJ48945.1 Crp/Fnr family transcriptional regulator [Gammaproteobacteria bacterium]
MKINGWRQYLPELEQSADNAICQLFDSCNIITLPENNTVFHQGDACSNYLIVLQGKVKVFTRAENGREILLYRLFTGDSCVLTTSCLLGNKNYPAEGKTETSVSALAIPANRFNQALQSSASFREIVFSAFSAHLSDLITLVEEVAFGKVDVRLARLLLSQCDNNILTSTHQNIATELGSAREVISRQLKELESKGIIIINRGSIEIIDIAALQDIADC